VPMPSTTRMRVLVRLRANACRIMPAPPFSTRLTARAHRRSRQPARARNVEEDLRGASPSTRSAGVEPLQEEPTAFARIRPRGDGSCLQPIPSDGADAVGPRRTPSDPVGPERLDFRPPLSSHSRKARRAHRPRVGVGPRMLVDEMADLDIWGEKWCHDAP
jgi:hypothetical protein